MSLRIDGDGLTAATDLRLEGASLVGTPPTGTGISTLAKGVLPTICHKVRVDYNACTAAATTQDMTLWTAPAGFVVERVIGKVNTVFAGTAITDVDITVGHTAGGAEYLVSFDADTAALLVGDVVAEIGAGLVDATRADVKVTSNAFVATTIQCRFTTVGGNLAAMTSGQVDFWIIGKQLPLV